jgi:hypothetical protein
MAMRTMIVAVMAAVLSLNCWIANAQEDTRHALAEELLDEMSMKEVVEKSFDAVKKMMPMQIKRMKELQEKSDAPSNAGKAADEMLTKVMDMVSKELSWDSLKEDYIAIYAETFTAEELEGAIAFYKSPVGKAFAQKQPELIEGSMKISQKRMMQIMPKMMTMLKELKKNSDAKPEEFEPEEPQTEGK